MKVPVLSVCASEARFHRLLISAATGAILAACAQPAFAQDDSAAEPIVTEQPAAIDANGQAAGPAQEIVVTGSRIARRDFEANSPIVTANETLFEQSATSSIESNLNKLPQFTPANLKTPTTGGGDIQPTARNTPGSAAVSLRGIGTNRTLVLVNGRRATPADATGTVDINTIPTAAIERVEIISGGASSTYGADAVAGVTNFILKRNFQGIELDAQTGITQRGDGLEYQFSGLFGTNFEDNRGNITVALSLNTREAAYNRNRSWYRDLWADPNTPGSGFFPEVAGVNLGFGNDVDPLVMASLFPGANPPVPGGGGITVYVNPDGTVFSGFDFAARGGASRAQVVDGYNVKQLATGALAANFTDAYTVFPARRYNIYTQGNYEITDTIGAFFQANFSNTQTSSVQEPAPVFAGWSAMVPYDPANPQTNIPAELRTILNNRANPAAPFQIFQMLPFNRESAGDVYSYNMTAGLEGTIPGWNWTWEVFGSQGKTQSTVTQAGFASLQRYRTLIAAPNFGQGFTQTGNPEQFFFGASTATCTSGLNPFGGEVSDDCLEAIKADIKTKSTLRQTIWEANAQGTLFALPAGDLKAAIGASYRENEYDFENDTLTTQGRSFIEQALGLYPAGNSEGTIATKEVYAELLVPVLHDLPFVQEFNLELGGRISDYNTTGTSYTYKALADWKMTDWLRLRGGYNRAERAPNVAELYLAPEQSFAFAPGGDACSRLNTLPYSANPATNPGNAAGVETLCRTLMGRAGPNAAAIFYGNPQPSGGGVAFPTLVGNPNLRPETADTWTGGVVISSPFEADLFRRMRLSIDYYNIKVSDAIGSQTSDIAQQQCFDTAFNTNLDPDSPYCAGVRRNADGGLGNVQTTFFNNGRFRTSGIDAQLDWSVPVGPGQINLNTVFNYLIDMKSAELDSLPLVDYAGTLGTTQNGLNGGSYEWRLFTTLGYSWAGNSVALQWRHLPSIEQEAYATQPNTTIGGYRAYDLFSLQSSFGITPNTTFRFGVENLFDKKPPLGGVDSAADLSLGVVPGGSYNAQFYDVIGRRFYVGLKAKF